jgi:uncharacterized damage-inducible protein DinB
LAEQEGSMRRVLTIAALGLAACSGTKQNPVSDALRDQWNGVKVNYQKSAEQMPEDSYGFKPTDKVRSFGEILAHVAGANYVFCADSKGEKSSFAEDYFENNAKTKADIVKAVNDSVAYCDAVFAAATDASLSEMVAPPSAKKPRARAYWLVLNIGHVNEHYGNLVTYFRVKDMVPPSSQQSGG